jgi:hypothetical protein
MLLPIPEIGLDMIDPCYFLKANVNVYISMRLKLGCIDPL